MLDAEHEEEDVTQRISRLFESLNAFYDRCQYRSASRIAAEIKRLARAERKLIPYLRALHYQTITAADLLDPNAVHDAALELIAVLESEDHARRIQPDLVQAEYEEAISRMSSCAYDNLATAAALANGYNSEGVHSGITEGIQICRRTGKLECITCFREYATDVYRASDDLEMALHHARQVAENGNVTPGFDRRWGGADSETQLFLLTGQLEAAEAAATRAMELTSEYHHPLRARLRTHDKLETIRLMKSAPAGAGTSPPDESSAGSSSAATEPAVDEFPLLDYYRDLRRALKACTGGDHQKAVDILTGWERKLTDLGCIEYWFEVRLRLIAAHRLAGNLDMVTKLARPLETRAKQARDWLTLRRLSRLLNADEPASPLAAAGPLTAGPFARVDPQPPPEREAVREPDAAAGVPSPQQPSPLDGAVQSLMARLMAAPEDAAVHSACLEEILALDPATVTRPLDAARLLHLIHIVGLEPGRAEAVWTWAERVSAPFGRDAAVLSLLADLGDSLRALEDSGMSERIPQRRIDDLFRQSLDLDPNNAGNFARAGTYYATAGNMGEAERCLARAFRLDRSRGFLALRLAAIYNETERGRDALSVLDMCLREGCDDSQVAWQAVTAAHGLGQYEMMLTYLDHFEALEPARPWVNYYRASGLIELGRAEEALAALDDEEKRQEQGTLHVAILRACAESVLGRIDRLRDRLAEVLRVRLSEVDYLTHNGLVRLYARLWNAAAFLPENEPLRRALDDLLLATGLAPNEFFDLKRNANPKCADLGFFVCTVRQPLGPEWGASPGCLAGEGSWTSYRLPWGVLAGDEAEAERSVLAWQGRCAPLPAAIEETQRHERLYTDHPGIVWQGHRSGEPES